MRETIRRYDSGFTLVEALVAMAILILIIGAIYGTFRAGSQSNILLGENADLHQTARVLLGRINSELCGIYQAAGSGTSALTGENSDTAGESSSFDTLEFTTVSHKPCKSTDVQGGVCSVAYSVESTKDGASEGLFIKEDFTPGLHLSDDAVENLPQTRISNLVVGMDCSYLDPDTGEWTEEWVDKASIPLRCILNLY
jgi:prepilin-type N-terminal cleavage/methylation domain-containing protein